MQEKENTTFSLTREQTAAMRGIAILAIVLHNYTHWLGPMVKENEYMFIVHNVRRLTVELSHPSWDIFSHLLSFFGHYGVPVFVFLSAFGLVKKYEESTLSLPKGGVTGVRKEESTWEFLYKHWKKLFTMMVVGYAAFVLVDYMTPAPRHYEFWNVVGQLGMFSNLYSDPDHDIWPGPYWYFGLTLQLYIVYRLVLYPGKGSLAGKIKALTNPFILAIVALAFLFVQIMFEPEGDFLNWYRYNCMGHLPVFILGLIMTRNLSVMKIETKRAHAIVTLLLSCFILTFSMEYITWMIVPFLIVFATISLAKSLPDIAMRAMVWIGGLSSYMFICHPIVRKVIIPISRRGDMYAGLLLYIVATIILAIVFKHIVNMVKSEKI